MTAHVLSLVARLDSLLRAEGAFKLARAIQATRLRHRDGCMSYYTMKSHVASLRGQAEAAGLLDDVECILRNEARS